MGLKGFEGYRVHAQVHVPEGKESISIVGLPDTSEKESKERVLSSIQSLGCDVSEKRMVVNLSP
ncbi:magnesium chelatase domain-containing protein [Cytobacillus firmus]